MRDKYTMTNENQQQQIAEKSESTRSDDTAGVVFSTVIKISDPNTGQVLLRVRGDE